MKLKTLLLLLLSTALLSFAPANNINNCLIAFRGATGLTTQDAERLPEGSEKYRDLKTENGEVRVSRIDGYRVLYHNNNNVPFVNMKVELSEEGAYKEDQKKLVENLRYLNSHSPGMETNELIELNFNGYKVWGSSRGSIEQGMFLGTFIMFPGNGVTVYFYFKNLKPGYRHFETVEEYKKLRDQFMNEYTKYLSSCK